MEKILISGYTKRVSRGVYQVELDTEKGLLSNLTEVAEQSGSTYLALDSAQHLYTVAAAGDEGGIAAFQYAAGKANSLNKVLAPGASLAYVAVDESRGLVYGANYHLGEIRVYKQLADGALELVDTVKHADHHGPKPEQKGALCHYANLTPDNRLAVCDLGNDAIYTYDIANTGKLTQHAVYQSAPGSGDRHLAFSPDGKHAYLACELDSTVEVLSYSDGNFKLLQKLTTLPASHTGFNGVAAIRLSSDGRYLYISNRGHDSLVSYKVAADGASLETLGWTATEGKIPRDFNFNLTENYIIVAHQESDNLSLFKRDKATGALTLLQKDFYTPEGTCVLPIK